jgi:hypothetical protein
MARAKSVERTGGKASISAGTSDGSLSAALGRGRIHKKRKRKFYVIEAAPASDFSYDLLNDQTLFSDGPPIFVPPPGQRGFRNYPETPVFRFNGRNTRDFEVYSFYWFISDRMKTVLERIEPEAFAFLKCTVQLSNGTDGPVRWLCDVVRVLDALDEEQSRVRIGTADDGSKVYSFSGLVKLIFKEDVIGRRHIFRMKYYDAAIICDEETRLACRAAGLTGLRFIDSIKY